jgi:hypothetical protein
MHSSYPLSSPDSHSFPTWHMLSHLFNYLQTLSLTSGGPVSILLMMSSWYLETHQSCTLEDHDSSIMSTYEVKSVKSTSAVKLRLQSDGQQDPSTCTTPNLAGAGPPRDVAHRCRGRGKLHGNPENCSQTVLFVSGVAISDSFQVYHCGHKTFSKTLCNGPKLTKIRDWDLLRDHWYNLAN